MGGEVSIDMEARANPLQLQLINEQVTPASKHVLGLHSVRTLRVINYEHEQNMAQDIRVRSHSSISLPPRHHFSTSFSL